MSDITKRLRCLYPIGPILENGEPEFGWRDFSGGVAIDLPTPLMIEAAETIDALFMQRDELLAQNAKLTAALDAISGYIESYPHDMGLQDFAKGQIESAKAEGKL